MLIPPARPRANAQTKRLPVSSHGNPKAATTSEKLNTIDPGENAFANIRRVTSHDSRNLAPTDTTQMKSYSLIDIISWNKVFLLVPFARNYLKIFRSIIVTITVFVMNNFDPRQLSSKRLLCDYTVQVDNLFVHPSKFVRMLLGSFLNRNFKSCVQGRIKIVLSHLVDNNFFPA